MLLQQRPYICHPPSHQDLRILLDLVSIWENLGQSDFMILRFSLGELLMIWVWSCWKRSDTSWEETCRLEFVDVADVGLWAFGPWSIESVLKDHLTNQSQIPPLW